MNVILHANRTQPLLSPQLDIAVRSTSRSWDCNSQPKRKPRRSPVLARSADDDVPPEVQGDWRAFRAGLISQAGKLLSAEE